MYPASCQYWHRLVVGGTHDEYVFEPYERTPLHRSGISIMGLDNGHASQGSGGHYAKEHDPVVPSSMAPLEIQRNDATYHREHYHARSVAVVFA